MKRLSPKLMQELKELRETRKSIDDFVSNYLINFERNAKLMHFVLKNPSTPKSIKNTAHQQYLIALVSSLETFLRDIFVYINSVDQDFFFKKNNKIDLPNIDDISLAEFISKSFNFQNLEKISAAFQELWDEDFLKRICTSEISPCGLNGEIYQALSIAGIFPNWAEILKTIIENRHRAVHDANYRNTVSVKITQQAESLFLLIPQVGTHLIADKYNLPTMTLSMNNSDKFRYLFSIHDLLAEDWHVA